MGKVTVRRKNRGRRKKKKTLNNAKKLLNILKAQHKEKLPMAINYSNRVSELDAPNLFNTATQNDFNDIIDVNKVLKLITPSDIKLNQKTIFKPIRTYSNKRKKCKFDGDIIESFGLPDDPIIPLNNHSQLRTNIDVNLSIDSNIIVNDKIIKPWYLDEIHSMDISYKFEEKNENNTDSFSMTAVNKIEEDNIKTDKPENKLQTVPYHCSEVNHEKEIQNSNSTETIPILKFIASPIIEATENYENINTNNSTDHLITEEDNLFSSFKEEIIDFEVGDIVWARVGSYAYWPSLITLEPTTNIHKQFFPKEEKLSYHVRFFGDRGRRAWVTDIWPFYGMNDMENISKQLKHEGKNPNLIKKLTVASGSYLSSNRNLAIHEAMSLISKSAEERLNYLDRILDEFEKKQKIKKDIKKKQKEDQLRALQMSLLDNQQFDKNTNKFFENNPSFIDKKQPILNGPIDNFVSKTETKHSKNGIILTWENQEQLYKRNNIFNIPFKSFICDICCELDEDETFKCCGCNVIYHYKCNKKIAKIKTDNIKNGNTLPNVIESKTNFLSKLDKELTLAQKIDFRMKEIMKNVDNSTCYVNLNHTNNLNKLEKTPYMEHITADYDNSLVEIDSSNENNKLDQCVWCEHKLIPPCSICRQETSKSGIVKRDKCSLSICGKHYHLECLKMWPQAHFSSGDTNSFVCPRHVCHTCIADDPRTLISRSKSSKLATCLKCPSTYHALNFCVPAGSEILNKKQIICPRHYFDETSFNKKTQTKTINTTWCFHCTEGGNLICCETCPTSVHVECLSTKLNTTDTYYCEECQYGRLPLYDDIVWVKLGRYRWWPALILFPKEIPKSLKNIFQKKGDFAVRFFGTYDYYWIGRGRSFLFHEGDSNNRSSVKSKVDSAFSKAIEEAIVAHKLKNEYRQCRMQDLNQKPPPYVKIKINKPVGNVRIFDANISNTTSCDCDPNEPFPCGPDSNCLNRLLLTECNPEICPAGKLCCNQHFEQRLYPPLIPYNTGNRGWGLKTLSPIRKGQFIIEYIGELINEKEYQTRLKLMHEKNEENYYFLTIDKDRLIDAGPKGNVARFMNHSCDPNCETQKWNVNGDIRIGLFACVDIPENSELTFNYHLECNGTKKQICKCNSPNCTGFIGLKVAKKQSEKMIKSKKCFICGELDENVRNCNHIKCNRFYHLQCVNIKKWNKQWKCSWHNCNICLKNANKCCIKCLNSYCSKHSDGNIRNDKIDGFVCSEHDPTKENVQHLFKLNNTESNNICKINKKRKRRRTKWTIIKNRKLSQTSQSVNNSNQVVKL